MEQTDFRRCITHCDRAIEGLRLKWLDGDSGQKADAETAALRLHDARMTLLAYVREHTEPDAWDEALALLPREP